jgi:chromatin segregation and condensation protein Rec8/ScpA/Scc1 (kleisin family)
MTNKTFSFLGYVTQPRLWSNRFTVAAVVVAMVNFGVEWDRRNRETYRLAAEAQRRAEEEQRRVEEEQRSAAERERAARRARIEARCRAAQIRFQLAPSDEHRQMLTAVLAILEEYGKRYEFRRCIMKV